MKKVGSVFLAILILSCNNRKEETIASTDSLVTTSDTLERTASSNAYADQPELSSDTLTARKPEAKQVKEPLGIYQAFLPYGDSLKIEQTIQFNKNHTFRLQEKFLNHNKDSMVFAEGTWTPSDGVIWLYKDQLVWGRYKWKGNTLQYFNPQYNKSYPMQQFTSILESAAWKNKKAEGVVLFGIGNEPFWSVEFNKTDTISFLLSEWKNPVKMKIAETKIAGDSTVYTAETDSSKLKLIVLPYFCNDGMSDHVYQNKILVQYNRQTYSGCGVVYR